MFLLGAAIAVTVDGQRAERVPPSEPYVWHNVVIVGGGFVPGIVFNAKQPDLIYARTDIGGAYRWNPRTKSWIPLTDWVSQSESNLLGIESLATDPVEPNRLYLAAGTYTQSWASNGAILRSADQGNTWQRTNMPFKMGGNEDGRSIGERLAIDPNQNRTVYFGSRNDGLWRSADYGVTWSKVDSFPVTERTNGVGIGFVLFDPRSGSRGNGSMTVYVGVAAPGHGLYRSLDSGSTWQAVPGQPKGLLPHHGLLTSGGMLYVTYGNAPGPNGMSSGAVWKFSTGAGVWTNVTPVAPNSPGAGGFGYAGLAADPSHPGTLMVSTMDKWSTGDDLYRTTDGGLHWTGLKAKSIRDSSASPFLNFGGPSAALGHWIGALAIDPFRPGHVLYGTGATIWGSDDATAADSDQPTHWTVRAQGLEETAGLDLVSPPVGVHLLSALGDIGGFAHDDLTTAPRAGMYTHPLINSTDSMDFAQSKPEIVVRVGSGSPGNTGASSLDGGASWRPFVAEPPGTRGAGSVAISADGAVIVRAPRNSTAFASTDFGASWTRSAGLPAGLSITSDRVNPSKFFAFDTRVGILYISVDGGMTFSVKATGLPTSGKGRLRAVPGREGDLWLPAENGGLLHTTDSGAIFSRLALPSRTDAVGLGRAAQGRSYPALYLSGSVGGVSGVFRSDDTGLTWVRINDDRHQYGWIGQVITGDPRIYGRVYLGTNGRGILYADPARASSARQVSGK